MKRFYFSDDEEYDDEEDIDESRFSDAEFLAMTSIGNNNSALLNSCIKICEKHIFWRFFSLSKKIKMIEKVYLEIRKITEEGDKNAEI